MVCWSYIVCYYSRTLPLSIEPLTTTFKLLEKRQSTGKNGNMHSLDNDNRNDHDSNNYHNDANDSNDCDEMFISNNNIVDINNNENNNIEELDDIDSVTARLLNVTPWNSESIPKAITNLFHTFTDYLFVD